MSMRTLTAGNLGLEPVVARHGEEMFAVLRDPAIYEYENPPPWSLQSLRFDPGGRRGMRPLDWVREEEGGRGSRGHRGPAEAGV